MEADEQVPVVPARQPARAFPRVSSSTALPTVRVRQPAPAQSALTWLALFAA
jgi:hypothetical protein